MTLRGLTILFFFFRSQNCLAIKPADRKQTDWMITNSEIKWNRKPSESEKKLKRIGIECMKTKQRKRIMGSSSSTR